MGHAGDSPTRTATARADDDAARPARLDYGIDSWSTVVRLGYASFGAGLVMLLAAIAHAPTGLTFVAFVVCTVLAISALVLVWSSRVGKLRERVRLVDWLDLSPDAYALDAGCGTGVVLVELARRVPEGLAVGIDLWGTTLNVAVEPQVARANAQLEGVDAQVVVTTGTIAALPFPDESFDAVTGARVLRELDGSEARVSAVREAARVLAPGGRLVVLETRKTRRIAVAMRSADLTDVTRSRRVWRALPPARYVTGVKPSS
jgi:SAM-dependent methyltransferase